MWNHSLLLRSRGRGKSIINILSAGQAELFEEKRKRQQNKRKQKKKVQKKGSQEENMKSNSVDFTAGWLEGWSPGLFDSILVLD